MTVAMPATSQAPRQSQRFDFGEIISFMTVILPGVARLSIIDNQCGDIDIFDTMQH